MIAWMNYSLGTLHHQVSLLFEHGTLQEDEDEIVAPPYSPVSVPSLQNLPQQTQVHQSTHTHLNKTASCLSINRDSVTSPHSLSLVLQSVMHTNGRVLLLWETTLIKQCVQDIKHSTHETGHCIILTVMQC